MSVELIQERLLSYQCQTVLEQENALKEISQEIVLLALSRAGFFKIAAFQGGTCLRILYGLERFSEDLDFTLETADPHFSWTPYLNTVKEEFSAYGYQLEIVNKDQLDKAIRSVFLKTDSTGGMLLLKDLRTNRPKIQIKLEIDINPPEGSGYELKYLDFPLPYSVKTQDLPSLFAGKCHALLCRNYTKGRDWYDFIWYVSRQTNVNLLLLTQAIQEVGPWKGQAIIVTPSWFIQTLTTKINTINWNDAKRDVARFLKPRELASLELWSREFFLSRIDKMANYLPVHKRLKL